MLKTRHTLLAGVLIALVGMGENQTTPRNRFSLDTNWATAFEYWGLHLKAEWTKNGYERDVFISREASEELKKWIEFKKGEWRENG